MELASDGTGPSPDTSPLPHWALDNGQKAKDGLESQTITSLINCNQIKGIDLCKCEYSSILNLCVTLLP